MLEPQITPISPLTPTHWLDQIDVAVELPMGPAGEQGPPGTAWLVGAGPPPAGEYDDGTLYLSGDGKVYRYENGGWEDTGVDLIPDAGQGAIPPHDHNEYLKRSGGSMFGPLLGTDAAFTGNVVVPTPDAGNEAVNLDYLTTQITNIGLDKFFGDSAGNAISTGTGGWNAGQGQAIYQHTGPGVTLPPGVTGATVGLTMRQSSGNMVQIICDVARNIWFTRVQAGSQWGQWSTLSPIVSTAAPVNPADGGTQVPHGTVWIQTDATVVP